MDAKTALRRYVTTFWKFVYWATYNGNAGLSGHCTASRISKPSLEAEPSEEEELSREGPGKFLRDGSLAVKLAVTLENFDLDCFYWDGFTFVSEKMRHVMALGTSDIQFFDVDATESAPLPRSKNYRTMRVLATEDVSDLKKSDYLARHCADGTLKIHSPFTVAFRPDAQPAHELFYDGSFKFIYCTDEFALRVLRAGCSGAFFFDPSRPFGSDTRLRTLSGVEEIVKWTKKLFRTKLIETIP
jgi:hypothetical protein